MTRRIGPYRIEGKLAGGGMADVFLGVHERIKRQAAIKTFGAHHLPSADARARLEREARAQASLQHANIVTLYDAGIDDATGEPFVAMEYIDGPTLEELLQRRLSSRVPWNEAVEMLQQILSALEYVHRKGIVHRDVKPSNVMVANGVLKLTDFGIALIVGVQRFTAGSTMRGTWEYAAPEQFEPDTDIDHRCDVYSCGLLLYRMLAGGLPYANMGDFAAIHARIAAVPDVRDVVPEVPTAVADALQMAVRRDPRKRFRTAAEFGEALRKAKHGFVPLAPLAEDQRPTVPNRPISNVVTDNDARSHTHTAAMSLSVVAMTMLTTFVLWKLAHPARLSTPAPQTPAVTAAASTTSSLVTPTDTSRAEQLPRAAVSEIPTKPSSAEPPPPPRQNNAVRNLRQKISAALNQVPALIEAKEFEAAHLELERLSVLAQQQGGLPDENDRIRELRTELEVAQRVAEKSVEIEAQAWERQLSAAQKNFDKKWLAEAKKGVNEIIEDPSAPEPVKAKAGELRQRIESAMDAAIKGISFGNTKHDVQRPAKPPQNNEEPRS